MTSRSYDRIAGDTVTASNDGWTKKMKSTTDNDTGNSNAGTHTGSLAVKGVLENNEIMLLIFTYLPIKEKAKNKLVCKEWEYLNTQSIQQSPKKAFETREELRKAVLIYCNQGGYLYDNEGKKGAFIEPPKKSQRQMVFHVYGRLINDWNVSKIENFCYVFAGCLHFDEDISSWNTSNAKSMSYMFSCARSFNRPLNGWNTSNVEDMSCMFSYARSFNQPLNGWNTSIVENMGSMFSGASSFNQPLNGWNTSNVQKMTLMFRLALLFNQPLNEWNTSKVKDMSAMFEGAFSFIHPIDMWDTSATTHPTHVFLGRR